MKVEQSILRCVIKSRFKGLLKEFVKFCKEIFATLSLSKTHSDYELTALFYAFL
ncbi:hypothetical protein [Campylobacter concisus]|uniref:hypothetical protein n=1 Tax=Campylobacter concisus TaxID=199 RepID=UPI00131BFFDF|nr:hypothetical protein [Campylobacter concisus]